MTAVPPGVRPRSVPGVHGQKRDCYGFGNSRDGDLRCADKLAASSSGRAGSGRRPSSRADRGFPDRPPRFAAGAFGLLPAILNAQRRPQAGETTLSPPAGFRRHVAPILAAYRPNSTPRVHGQSMTTALDDGVTGRSSVRLRHAPTGRALRSRSSPAECAFRGTARGSSCRS